MALRTEKNSNEINNLETALKTFRLFFHYVQNWGDRVFEEHFVVECRWDLSAVLVYFFDRVNDIVGMEFIVDNIELFLTTFVRYNFDAAAEFIRSFVLFLVIVDFVFEMPYILVHVWDHILRILSLLFAHRAIDILHFDLAIWQFAHLVETETVYHFVFISVIVDDEWAMHVTQVEYSVLFL